MRPILKLYVGLVITSAALLLVHDLSVLVDWPFAPSLGVTIALIVLTAVGDQLQFEVQRGWHANASAAAHIGAAFLLPPAEAMAIAALGLALRALRYPRPLGKMTFNVASVALAVGVAAHVADAFGGPERVTLTGSWTDPLVGLLVSATYCWLSTSLLAGALAIDKRGSIVEVIRTNLVIQSAGEVGLGLVGALLAAMLSAAPTWAPTLLVPASLLYVAKQSMDRADRRSRNLAMTSAIGRAVAGTLDPQRAFQAIAETTVLDGLKLDGLALMPIGPSPVFAAHVVSECDRPALRTALLEQLAARPKEIELDTRPGHGMPDWVPSPVRHMRLAAAALPFGAGAHRPVGALMAWRELRDGDRAYFDREEMLVLKTLADYAAVTLESARLTQEAARLHHEAGQAEAQREMESLRQVARLKDEFLGQVSHELRTPLTIIHGYAELIVDGMLNDRETIRESAGEIHSSSALMLRLVDDLLDTSRLDAGRIELKLVSLNLSNWLIKLVTSFGQTTPSHRVVVDVCEPMPTIDADPDRLGQVMHNLLSNAARYSPEGAPIRVSADVARDAIEIKVVDQGSGIAADDRARIFEKFYRGKHGATLAVRGTGLGLAVARQLIEAHGGSIGVDSALGRGSTFWVRLPLQAGGLSRAQAA
jgi:signal transduction histidine kinase